MHTEIYCVTSDFPSGLFHQSCSSVSILLFSRPWPSLLDFSPILTSDPDVDRSWTAGGILTNGTVEEEQVDRNPAIEGTQSSEAGVNSDMTACRLAVLWKTSVVG